MKKIITVIAALSLALIPLAACQSTTPDNSNVLTIKTTAYPIVEFTKRIGGDAVDVQSVFANGSDSHTYDPTPQEMVDLNDADLFLNIDIGDYHTITEKLKAAAPNLAFVDVAAGVAAIEGDHDHSHDESEANHDGEHDHEFDPHIWLDPVRATLMAENIKNELVRKLPEQAATFETNFAALKAELATLNDEFTTGLAPYAEDTFFVTHAAYGYLADEYHLHQVSLSGLSADSELSSAQLVEIAEQLKAHNTKYILAEENVSNKQADVLASELGISTLPIYNLETLTQAEIDGGQTYFTLMRENLKNLQEALKQ
ncbi:metal ABC transporter solute-binding protein, Zn/Mn family [Culicoidibacter larvae]|uniref:Adhesin n=1 Tax=Culicoidibacter larvae TaxID=2579976 RepID=A0A5R8QFD9_9FIRM|nr:zinc ABC transporter substrate-binding protein [Culicoidibacter larvae]TLG76708.1 adhesin [Culicoidibacter larvae]